MGMRSLVWTVGLSLVSALGVATETLAQNIIISDDTLGEDFSFVAPLSPTVDGIGGGAVREQNLFHSFEVFDIGDGNGAYFIADSDAINNIFARVTGNEFSKILGVLGTSRFTNGFRVPTNANLYLINPNGILFGPNSALDIGGSLIVTTADTIRFGADEFRASNPNLPSSVLTVDPSSYLFTQPLPADIVSFSASGNQFRGLRVPNGSNLTFLAGNVDINGQGRLAGLHAFGGLVELAAAGGPGEVNIGPTGELIISETVPNGEVLLTDRAQIDVSLGSGGNINIMAGDINVTNASFLNAGISEGLG